ncbi:DNA double-strand break repair protein Mre11 [uncultured archaeon]|nr:DNA double-strand break repair protein Mre11 [uncultured archaeon]
MKLAILSDFHLGYDRFREDAYSQAEEALISAASCADALLLPGDLFDIRAPKPEVLAEAINLFRNLSRMDWKTRTVRVEAEGKSYTTVPLIAIAGTHERRAQRSENPVNLLALAGMLIDVSDGFAVLEKGNERVAVYGIGGVSEEQFADTIRRLNPRPMPGCFNVFMFHQSTKELLPFDSGLACFDDLPKGFDLYVDGHIHNRVEKKVHGKPFLIPGSTVLTQLKNSEQEEKGFYVYDTADNSYAFHKITSRRFVVVKVDAAGKEPMAVSKDIREAIERAIPAGSGKPIIKVEITGKLKPGFKNLDLDTSAFSKTYKDRAIVEVAKAGMESVETNSDVDALRKGSFDNVSVKDYGLGIFVEKLKQNKYDLDISPSELFEMLSSETSKDKATKKVLEALFP